MAKKCNFSRDFLGRFFTDIHWLMPEENCQNNKVVSSILSLSPWQKRSVCHNVSRWFFIWINHSLTREKVAK